MSMTITSTSAPATATCGWIEYVPYIQSAGQAIQDHGRYTNEAICTEPGSFCAVQPDFGLVQCVPALTTSGTAVPSRSYYGLGGVATGYTAVFYDTCVNYANATQTNFNPYALTCTDSAYPYCTKIPANLDGGNPVRPITASMLTCVDAPGGPSQVLNLFTTVSNSVEYVAMAPVTMAPYLTLPISVSSEGVGGGPAVGIPAYTAYLSTTINSNPTFSAGSHAGLSLSAFFSAAFVISLLLI